MLTFETPPPMPVNWTVSPTCSGCPVIVMLAEPLVSVAANDQNAMSVA